MTVSAVSNRVSYSGTGSLTPLPVSFPFFAPADLVVIETVIATGVETTKVLTTDYTITGTQDTLGHYPNGGTVTPVIDFPTTVTWAIYRDPALTQTMDLVENDNLPAESVEAEFDYVTMLIQRLADQTSRSIRQTDGETALIGRLPSVVLRANKYLAFDSSGNPEAVDAATASGTSVTATGTTTARLLADWFADFVNVRSWGAVGDGTVNDTAAVTAAVAEAYSLDRELYWPAGGGAFGTYLLTASIPNFHDVQHVGPGVVHHTGGTDFYVDPSLNPGKTNVLYVSTAGDDTNDGLDDAYPMLTVQHAAAMIYRYSYGDVTWKIQFAAGTYSVTYATFSRAFPSPSRVQFLGGSVAAGVQPTTIFEAAGYGVGTGVSGLYFQGGIRVQVSNINFRNYRTNASPSATSLSAGLLCDGRSEMYTFNVWTDGSDQGVYVTNGSQIRMEAGRHGFNSVNGCSVQLIRHCQGSIGYNGSAADITGATGTAFIGGQYGVQLQEFSMSHTDNCYYEAQTLSGALLTLSRIHSVTSTYHNCLVGIDARNKSNIGMTSNTFTGCTTDTISRSGSFYSTDTISDSLYSGAPMIEWGQGGNTQSASPVSVYTHDFYAKELQARGNGFKLELVGDVTGTANTKTIVVTLGSTTLLTATIAATTLDYDITVEVMDFTSASSQKVYTKINQSGVLPVTEYSTITENLDNAKTLTVTHQVTNTGDLNRIGWTKLAISH